MYPLDKVLLYVSVMQQAESPEVGEGIFITAKNLMRYPMNPMDAYFFRYAYFRGKEKLYRCTRRPFYPKLLVESYEN